MSMPGIDLSSNLIRQRTANDETIRFLCQSRYGIIFYSIIYIEEMEPRMTYTIEDIQNKLHKKLKGSRYIHTLGVEYTSVCLAMKYGESLEKRSWLDFFMIVPKSSRKRSLLKYAGSMMRKFQKWNLVNHFCFTGKPVPVYPEINLVLKMRQFLMPFAIIRPAGRI